MNNKLKIVVIVIVFECSSICSRPNGHLNMQKYDIVSYPRKNASIICWIYLIKVIFVYFLGNIRFLQKTKKSGLSEPLRKNNMYNQKKLILSFHPCCRSG